MSTSAFELMRERWHSGQVLTLMTRSTESSDAGEDEPEPTEVVIGPDSMYTPETYQFSGVAVLTMRRTPTWKSSELVEVEAAMLSWTLVSAAEPLEAQRPTVPAEN